MVFVRDANGCTDNIVIPIDIGVELAAEAIPQYGCDGIFPNSTVSVVMQDNSVLPQVLFALDPVDPTDAVTAQATDVRTWGDLPAGDHIVYIYHENGCTTFEEFTIDPYEPLTLDALQTGPAEITAMASGGFGGYEYFFNGESYGSDNIFSISYDADQVTTLSQRFLAAELVREKLIRLLREELPYALTVEIEQFQEDGRQLRIHAVIWVERPGQKAIVIGRQGVTLKTAGQQARIELEKLLERPVFLQTWVKVRAGWSDDERALQHFGYRHDT